MGRAASVDKRKAAAVLPVPKGRGAQVVPSAVPAVQA